MVEQTPDTLSLTIWGARGSIPAPGRDTLRYGGETTCFELRVGEKTILIDCGSGIRPAGGALARRGVSQVDVLFTHTHMDHLCGLPFFCLAYDPTVKVNLWAGHVPPGGTLEKIIERMMSPPIFPVATSALNNTFFRSYKAGETITLDCGVTVRTVRLNHPGNACGYRFDHAGSSIAIITDHEHGNPAIDDPIAELVEGADVMIYDAMYLDSEYPRFVGWGHSTPGEALALAARAGVKIPVLFHHDPDRTDDELDRLLEDARRRMPTTSVAYQGQTFTLRGGRLLETSNALASTVS
ncbi:MBL fold metallo-hydrolase [Acuticoccus mangrovi]|uniref:MBL fold metallo-hydrolase n=1 Tax=Acuticoccus mangrovi TaxID=2796142 RepID=A0A934II52_9HYPH|nr:MBL fold metallo-hydrolase [Acuticoccus mangrovi]MBJ3777154.1 MBL fold metallo-hydrolase [Acuticoccus mangrovi]